MTYEISIEAGTITFATTKHFASIKEAIAWAKHFAADWYQGAEYFIFCRDSECFFNGRVN